MNDVTKAIEDFKSKLEFKMRSVTNPVDLETYVTVELMIPQNELKDFKIIYGYKNAMKVVSDLISKKVFDNFIF